VLRQDNADRRLMMKGHKLGLVSDLMVSRLHKKEALVAAGIAMAAQHWVPSDEFNAHVEKISGERIEEKERLAKLVKRPNVRLAELVGIDSLGSTPTMKEILTNDSRTKFLNR
jgi:tRNA uridine 5-carboxymethylaminomethyl modification enzyme